MEDVVTQPYDKITPEMQQAYYDRSRYNLIRVILRQTRAGRHRRLCAFARGRSPAQRLHPRRRIPHLLAQKRNPPRGGPNPRSTATRRPYQVPATGEMRERRGFIALGHLYDYTEHVVYRHEQTFPKHKSDRLALFKATRAYCEQIYMLYSDPAFTAETLIFGSTDGTPTQQPDLTITDEYGVEHRVWRLTDPHLINLICTTMQDKKLIIADGHHRYETSVTYMHERAAQLGLEPPRTNSVILKEQSKSKDLEAVLPDSVDSHLQNPTVAPRGRRIPLQPRR